MAGYTDVSTGGLLTAAGYNGNFEALELSALHVWGYGVISGLTLSTAADLDLPIAAGVLTTLKTVSLASVADHTLPDASTRYIWIDNEGNTLDTGTTASPGAGYVCLGKAVTSGGAITSVTTENRWYAPRFSLASRTWTFGDPSNGTGWIYDGANGRLGFGVVPTRAFQFGVSPTVPGLTLAEQGSSPSDESGFGKLFAKTSDSELYYRDDSGNETRLTNNGVPSYGYAARSVTTTDDIEVGDAFLAVDTTGGAVTINLVDPTGWDDGRIVTIKDVAGTAATNNITLDPAPGVNLDGSGSNRVISLAYGSIRIAAYNGHWYTV